MRAALISKIEILSANSPGETSMVMAEGAGSDAIKGGAMLFWSNFRKPRGWYIASRANNHPRSAMGWLFPTRCSKSSAATKALSTQSQSLDCLECRAKARVARQFGKALRRSQVSRAWPPGRIAPLIGWTKEAQCWRPGRRR